MSAPHSYGPGCEECEGHCLQKRPGGVMAALAFVDSHLQALQHYGHSHELREAMSLVQELLTAVEPLFNRNATIYANEITLPMASHRAALQALRAVRAAVAKAMGSAS